MTSTAPTTSEPVYRLLVLGNGSARTLPLTGDRWLIGRALDCSITLRDPTVSRRHLELERRGDRFHFQDLGGANPALLDGIPTRAGVLDVGQTLSIGLTRLTLEARMRPSPVVTSELGTVILSREVIDDEQSELAPDPAATATRVLRNLEWAFADLGDLSHAAEPLLELAMGLTERNCGWIVRFAGAGEPETLALNARAGTPCEPALPQSVLEDARRIETPHLLRTREGHEDRERDLLLVPMGADAEGLLVLEHPEPDAPDGQALLQLAQAIGRMVWQRLLETMERERLRTELQRLSFRGSEAHTALQTSMRLQPAREQARSAADDGRVAVLVGEPGTEREEMARYLHGEGSRHAQPFLTFRATERTPQQQRRELLGHADKVGLCERAVDGSLFIDDADRLPADLQRDLVAVLARRQRPPRLILAVDGTARVDQLVDELRGETAPPITMPPLRDNPQDVLALAEMFLAGLGPNPKGSPRVMTERTKRTLTAYEWPGNVQELRISIEAAACAAGNQPIAPRHLPAAIGAGPRQQDDATLPSLADVERQHIEEVMRRTGGVRARAAQVLGIASSTLYEKIKKYQIDR